MKDVALDLTWQGGGLLWIIQYMHGFVSQKCEPFWNLPGNWVESGWGIDGTCSFGVAGSTKEGNVCEGLATMPSTLSMLWKYRLEFITKDTNKDWFCSCSCHFETLSSYSPSTSLSLGRRISRQEGPVPCSFLLALWCWNPEPKAKKKVLNAQHPRIARIENERRSEIGRPKSSSVMMNF